MYKTDFICFSINNWEKRRARKQQFMLHLALREDVGKVLYIEPALNFWRLLILPFFELKTEENRHRWMRALKFKFEPAEETKKLFIFTPIFFIPFAFRIYFIYNLNLFLFVAWLRLKIRKMISRPTVLWFYHPFDYHLLKWFREREISVFDWAEEWADYFIELSEKRKKYVVELEEKIIKDVDIVFTVSFYLLEKAQKLNPHTYRLLDGTVYKVFSHTQMEIPPDLKNIKKPIAGYLGTINERIDIELLEYISNNLPDISIVMIGDIHYERTDWSRLKRCPNIFFLGAKKYEELINYASYFDISLLPYLPALTLSFPTKVMDYLAIGRPIVSTDLAELEDFKDYLYIACSKEEFAALMRMALSENNPALFQKRKNLALQNTWSRRVEEIMDILNKRMAI
ncbi:MAG: glycosyltransferase [Candidatus Omnitrophica bacterium]|nr:glycosyltransferase [Candidatus Omnitrophota bacterium]